MLTVERWVMRRMIGSIVSSILSTLQDSSSARNLSQEISQAACDEMCCRTVVGRQGREVPIETSPRTGQLWGPGKPRAEVIS